jgi:hypothetical protein
MMQAAPPPPFYASAQRPSIRSLQPTHLIYHSQCFLAGGLCSYRTVDVSVQDYHAPLRSTRWASLGGGRRTWYYFSEDTCEG